MKFPKHALDNKELLQYVKMMKLSLFRGVLMKNGLQIKIRKHECGIINIEPSEGFGTHWTSYVEKENYVIYFDCYGNLWPPKEIVEYFHSDGMNNIQYN